MKKTVISIFVLIVSVAANSQDVKRTLGVGLQSSFPVFGLSIKYGITDQSMVQATIAPFGVKTDGGSTSMNFYGARYIHRFPGNDESNLIFDPYLFAGGGLISYKTNYTQLGLGKTTDNFFGYSAGGGIEMIAAKKIGFSAELGYGKLGLSGGVGVNTILFGVGIHYYIK